MNKNTVNKSTVNGNSLLILLTLFIVALTLSFKLTHANDKTEHDPAEISIGERLFLETRFAQSYFVRPGMADAVVNKTITSNNSLTGPFAGKTINCRACHIVDEHQDTKGAGMRTYADYAPHSPVPKRADGRNFAERNAMSMVNISIPRQHGQLFHFDGQFNSLEDLVRGTLTGRNFGWLPGEQQVAIKHIANIIRTDDGKGELGKEFGGSYRKILKGTAQDLAEEFLLPVKYRIDVDKASDQQILDAIAKLVAVYVGDLGFARDDEGYYNGSPYDQFLLANKLPRAPARGESLAVYNQRLLKAVNTLQSPRFIKKSDGKFVSHQQAFMFAENELRGMKLFFSEGSNNKRGGNCASCHTAPHFSDFGFHNTGLTQINYDDMHGAGQFNKLTIPDLTARHQNYDEYLPTTEQHPQASSRFRSVLVKDKPGNTDLGLWNVFANPDMPAPQAKIKGFLCEKGKRRGIDHCTDARLLPLSIAAFKTPVLRDLGHSNPYMHTGQFNDLESAVRLYLKSSAIARAQQLRNLEPALQHINITQEDIYALVAFLTALNEDYD